MNAHKVIYWTPRVLSILFILFLAMFSLDVFDGHYGFWGTVVGLLMHNIPSLALLALLIVAWKREIVGAVAFAVAGFLYIASILFTAMSNHFEWYMLSWCLIIAGPAFLIAVLFFINWKRRQGHSL